MKTLFSKLVAVALCAMLASSAEAAGGGNATQFIQVPTTARVRNDYSGTQTKATLTLVIEDSVARSNQNVYIALNYQGTLYWATGSGWTTDVSSGYPVFGKFNGLSYTAVPVQGLDATKFDTSVHVLGEGVFFIGFGTSVDDMIAKGQLWLGGGLGGMMMSLRP